MTTADEIELARTIAVACYGSEPVIEALARFNNPVFRLRFGDERKILKISKHADGAAVRKETALIALLHANDIPAPEVEHADQTGERAGRPFFIMRSAGDRTVAEFLGPGDIAHRLLLEMGELLARIHLVRFPDCLTGVDDRISAAGVHSFLEKLGETADSLAALRLFNSEDVARFKSLGMPSAEGNALCHSDYHAVQCVVEGDRISAVVDWESAWAGNPAIDAAISHAYLDYYCPQDLVRAFLTGYTSIRALPEDYSVAYLPVRMAQTLGMVRAWYTRGRQSWDYAVRQGKVDLAVRLWRTYARLHRE